MTKVAIIGPIYPYRGGIAQYTAFLCRTLNQFLLEKTNRTDLLLISYKRQYPTFLFPGESDKDIRDKDIGATPNVDIEEKDDDNPIKPHFWIDSLNPATWFYTLYRLQRYKPEVLLIQWWTSFWAPLYCLIGVWAWLYNFVLARIFSIEPISLVILCHNVLPHETRWWDIMIAKWAIGWGDRYIVQSETERLRLHAVLPAAQSTVVPHPQYDTLVELRLPQQTARMKLQIDPDVYILLFFGIVRPYKGLKDLLYALPELAQMHPTRAFQLIIAGEFWEDKQVYLDIIWELALSDSIIIDDCYVPTERVALYFSAADVLVAPYLYETGSAVLGMAKGFGLATVSAADIERQHNADRPNDNRPQAIAKTVSQAMQTESDSQIPLENMKDGWEILARAVLGNNRTKRVDQLN